MQSFNSTKSNLNGVLKVKNDDLFQSIGSINLLFLKKEFTNLLSISKHAVRKMDLLSMGWFNYIGKWCGKIAGGKHFM